MGCSGGAGGGGAGVVARAGDGGDDQQQAGGAHRALIANRSRRHNAELRAPRARGIARTDYGDVELRLIEYEIR